MQISPNRLLILRSVATEGGVLAAARALRLAPSGVSAHLAALERETGLVLLDRSQRGGQRSATLTEAGAKIAAQASRLFDILADIDVDVATLLGDAGGDITIAAFPSAIRHLVAPAMNTLAKSHPAIRIRVVELDPADAIVDLHAGRADIVIVEHDLETRPTVSRGLVYHHLQDDLYRLVVPRAWPEPQDLREVAGRPWVDGPANAALHLVLERLRTLTGLPFPGRHLCVEFPAALAIVSSGHAAALIPDLALPRAIPATVRVVTLQQLGGRRIGAVHRPGRYGGSRSVAATIEALSAARSQTG